MSVKFLKNGTNTSDATATAEDIINNKTAYIKGKKVVGSMPNNEALNYSVSTSEQIIPKGYTTGGIIQASPQLPQEYADCLNISNIVLEGGVTLYDIEDIPESEQYSNYMVFTYYDKTYCVMHNNTPFVGYQGSSTRNTLMLYGMTLSKLTVYEYKGLVDGYETITDYSFKPTTGVMNFEPAGKFTIIYSNIDIPYDGYWQTQTGKDNFFDKKEIEN